MAASEERSGTGVVDDDARENAGGVGGRGDDDDGGSPGNKVKGASTFEAATRRGAFPLPRPLS